MKLSQTACQVVENGCILLSSLYDKHIETKQPYEAKIRKVALLTLAKLKSKTGNPRTQKNSDSPEISRRIFKNS